jgi:hypothetical protein
VARTPRSNWRRHAATLAIRDQVRGYVASREALYGEALSLIEQRFAGAEALSRVLEDDAALLARRAQEAAGLEPLQPDPITPVVEDFEGPVTLEAAAALLLVSPEELRDNLALLDPALSSLDGGTVPRSVFTSSFAASRCTLGVLLVNQPDPSSC